MRELITAHDQLDVASQASSEREPSLHELQTEDLPPLNELINEHRAMVAERRQIERQEYLRFNDTMIRWARNERGKS